MSALSLMMQELVVSGSEPFQDSRSIPLGGLFFAIRGTANDGHQYVPEILSRSDARCVVAQDYQLPVGFDESYESRLIRVLDPREAYAWACASFFRHPSRSLLMVGVTGTSGKTTTTYLIESVLRAAGHRVGLIGTVNFRIGDRVIPSTHTTPGCRELQQLLAEMKREGCTAVVMEVSSHALKQHRSLGIAFDAMVFTNLSREHLDYHPDMEDYFQSKRLLFTRYFEDAKSAGKTPQLIINGEDDYGQRLSSGLESPSLWTFSLKDSGAHRVVARSLEMSADGIIAEVCHRGEPKFQLKTPLVARFNASNAMAAATVGLSLGFSPEVVAAGISSLSGVPGRLEKVSNPLGLTILVDYAHKPDALEKVLLTLRELRRPGQRIITVVGCGGDRDRTKRPVMGKIAESLSDLVVVTSDNPRTENPSQIIEQVVSGIARRERAIVEADRRQAIFKAVREARPGDLVLIAGKGHEDYQIIADPSGTGGVRKIPFDDRQVASEACQTRSES